MSLVLLWLQYLQTVTLDVLSLRLPYNFNSTFYWNVQIKIEGSTKEYRVHVGFCGENMFEGKNTPVPYRR